jgi:hypothetical protein
LLRALNRIGAGVASHSRLQRPLDADRLIDTARQRTGLDDFGEPDLHGPLKILTRSLEAEAKMSFIGRIATRSDLLHLLANRLRLQADRSRYPQIGAERIERPIFILGLPRSGSTLLHQLLAQDKAHHIPVMWEVRRPSPPPGLAEATRAARIRKTAREAQWFNHMAPPFKRIHPLGARLPQECIEILSHSFTSSRFHTTHFVPTYQAWLDQQDLTPAYQWHRRFLQHLQWRDPRKRWVLKAPAHLFALDALLNTYPDAAILQMHRDPRTAMGSMLSMTVVVQSVFSDHVNSDRIAREVTERWGEMMERAMRVRARAERSSAATFIDIDYTELVHAPLRTVARIYRRLNLTLTPETRAGMHAWLAGHRQHRHGRHHYSLEEFGLDADEQAKRFRHYMRAFNIPLETSTSSR